MVRVDGVEPPQRLEPGFPPEVLPETSESAASKPTQ
jgi:hypothetical protein